MKQKTRTRVLSWLLSLVMILSLVPGMSITALAEETTDKTVAGLGTSAIGNPTSTNSSASAWAGSYVYYGKYDGTTPTKYRVLDKASNDFGVDGGSLLLDCDTTLYNAKFHDSNNAWSSSSLKSGLQGDAFWNKSGVFTEREKDAIASSTKADAAQNDGSGSNILSYAALSDDTVFVLDAKEASRASYGYASKGTRKKSGTSGNGWWLRSPNEGNGKAGFVLGTMDVGRIGNNIVSKNNAGVSPAFNINLSSVIFTSLITGTAGAAGAEYKLTLKDDKLSIAVTTNKTITKENNTLTIPYTVSGDNSANATQVSVLVTDKAYTESDAKILAYGKAADVTDASLSGKANFTLPDNLTGTLGTNYHIYLLAEDVNGEKETDYANLKEITADDVTAHEHSFTYTASGATITAMCGASGCELDDGNGNHTATLTIAAPLHTAVGDGKSADAQITDENQLKGSATVSYYATDADSNKTGNALTSAPTDAGTYWAEITLTNGGNGANDSATAHVVYTITNPDYNVTLPTGLVGGSVGANPTTAKFGAQVTLTITLDNGFTLKSLTVKDGENNDVAVSGSGNTRTFTMPASNVTVSATFEGQPFAVTTVSDPTIGGTVAVSGSGVETTSGATTAKAGTEVTLTATPATGFSFVNFAVKTASNNNITVADNKFTMPTEAVTVSATFEGKSTTATLDVTGNTGTTCTAKLLNSSYEEIDSVTKKGGEQFILLVNRDEGYDFAVTYGTNSPVTLKEFTPAEYEAYVAYAKENNLAVSSSMILAWATMPGVSGESVTLTVNFSKLKTFTVLYQPSEENTTAAWCKFAYTEAGSLVTDSAQMKSDTVMGDGTKVYSLKVTAAFSPEKVTFATTKEAVDAVATDDMTACSAKQSAAESDWTTISNDKFCVIGGNAKTVVAAFVTDTNSIKVYNGNSNREDMGQTTTATDGVTYRLAVVTESGGTVTPGAVKAPDAPANSDESIDFAGWWGFEFDENGKEKVYAAGADVPVSKNITFTDTWKPATLTITLNRNGGTGGSSTTTATYGEAMTAPDAPTRSGFAFDGWTVSETVTENGELFVKGTPFANLNTPITADMGLTAQWKHVHTYTCYRVTLFSKEYHGYDSSVHVALCACGNARLEAHAFDSSGKCACGYEKPGPKPVKLEVSYVRFENSTYTTRFKGLPQPMNPNSGEEVTISAPNGLDEDYWFTKWQFSTDNGETWSDLAAAEEVSFIIPCDMLVRALYVNGTTKPQVELSASKYKQDVEVKGYTFKADNILFQMHYKLPDGYTFVDAGVRVGDNDGIVYYELKEKTREMSTGGKAASWVGATFLSFFTGGPEIPETSATERYYEVRKSNAVADLGAEKVAKYMYENEPVSAKAAPILYEAKSTTKGSCGSVATIPPIGLAQSENKNNWIYGIGWLRYKTPQGEVETIYTDALAATLNNMPTNTVTKQGS